MTDGHLYSIRAKLGLSNDKEQYRTTRSVNVLDQRLPTSTAQTNSVPSKSVNGP